MCASRFLCGPSKVIKPSYGGYSLEGCLNTSRICRLASTPGKGKYSSLSNLPGRLSAGSTASMRLVAPMTISPGLLSSPSIRASKVATTLEWIWSVCLSLTGARPSNSSKNIMAGLHLVAYLTNGQNIGDVATLFWLPFRKDHAGFFQNPQPICPTHQHLFSEKMLLFRYPPCWFRLPVLLQLTFFLFL